MKMKMSKQDKDRYAALGVQAEIDRLQAMIGGRVAKAATNGNGWGGRRVPKKKKRRKMSKEARERIAAAMKARWNKTRKGNGKPQRGRPRAKPHWTQLPENKAKLIAQAKHASAVRVANLRKAARGAPPRGTRA